MATTSVPALATALLVVATACERSPARDAPSPEPSTTSAAAPATAAVPALARSGSPPPRCRLRLERVEFLECNPRPAQSDYPECWTYAIEPAPGASRGPGACLPAEVTLVRSGWQAMLDELRAKLVQPAERPNEATLTLTRVESSLSRFESRPGAVLGTLVFEAGEAKELRFGPGMRARTGVAAVRR